MNKMTKEQLKKLSTLSDEDIDYSDIPAVNDFSGFVRAHNKSTREIIEQSIKQQSTLKVDWQEIKFILDNIQQANKKDRISLRLDSDIANYYKRQGKKYQTRINDILRAFMIAEKKAH